MKIITLCREYGAGGHSIGRKVAQELGIAFYDKDIIRGAAEAAGIDPGQIEAEEELLTGSEVFFRAISPIAYDQKDLIYDVQRRLILDIARRGACVILGRCADAILEEAGIESLDVFLYADTAHRMKRVGELIGSDDMGEITHAMRKADHARHSYYKNYTGRHWGDYRNFDLLLDTGSLGYETCIRLICQAAMD